MYFKQFYSKYPKKVWKSIEFWMMLKLLAKSVFFVEWSNKFFVYVIFNVMLSFFIVEWLVNDTSIFISVPLNNNLSSTLLLLLYSNGRQRKGRLGSPLSISNLFHSYRVFLWLVFITTNNVSNNSYNVAFCAFLFAHSSRHSSVNNERRCK